MLKSALISTISWRRMKRAKHLCFESGARSLELVHELK